MTEAIKTVFDTLIGKKIDGIFTDAEKFKLSFKIGDEWQHFYADGDCCSNSWFNHFSGTETLIGQTLLEVKAIADETLDGNDPRKGKETDCERVYGFVFTTSRGRADLDMRNDSNGYYSGSVERVGAYSWRTKLEDWKGGDIEIKEDF